PGQARCAAVASFAVKRSLFFESGARLQETGMRLIRVIACPVTLLAAAWLLTPAHAQSPGNFSTLSTTGAATLNGDVLMCSGRPWLDVRCNGAVGDGSHDDTAAIQATINTAVTNNWPVHIPA